MRLLRRGCVVPALLFSCLAFPLGFTHAQERPSTPIVARQASLDDNLPEIYKKWLNEDVRWIITDEERADFNQLSLNEQRDAFVVAFWERRNPTPGASRNKFKEEHYRRLAYANTHFAAKAPGWQTDRGRFYIMYGPPDETEQHPQFPGPHNSRPAYDIWRYRYLKGIGRNISLEFIDTCGCGDFHLERGSSEKDPPGVKESFPWPNSPL